MTTPTSRSESSDANPLAALGEALEAAAESIGGAQSDARAHATESAKAAAIKVQSGVGTGAYYAAYGISYSLVFSGVFIRELLPVNNPIRRGFEDGAVAAYDAATRRVAHEVFDPEDSGAGELPRADEALRPD